MTLVQTEAFAQLPPYLQTVAYTHQFEQHPAYHSLQKFSKIIFPRYIHAPHLAALDHVLEQATRYTETDGTQGIGPVIVIMMPPRHGKSQKVSRIWPAWHLGRNPEHRVILTSYGDTLARKHSRAARNFLKEPVYQQIFPDVTLAQDSASVMEWNLEAASGGLNAMGILSGITGMGANVLVVDDPVKNRAEAESATIRQRTWEAYTDDILTRLEPHAVIVIMMTRWHTDDLIGRVLDEEPDAHVLRLPALAHENDPLGRQPGEALWPVRYNRQRLLKEQSRGEYRWASLYDQTPMPSKAGLFDVALFQEAGALPEFIRQVRFYDLAVTSKKHSDYSVGLKMAITADEDIYILDVWRAQLRAPDVKDAIIANAQKDGKGVPVRLEAEKAGIIQLDYLLREKALRGYGLDAKAPQGDKYTRATPLAARVKAGKVYLVKAAWNKAFLDEVSVFPMGGHDDQVDAASGAYDYLSEDQMLPIRRLKL